MTVRSVNKLGAPWARGAAVRLGFAAAVCALATVPVIATRPVVAPLSSSGETVAATATRATTAAVAAHSNGTHPAGGASMHSASSAARGSALRAHAGGHRGTVYSWGDDQKGQLGDGATGINGTPSAASGGLPDVKQVATGDYHALALTADGNVWSWGSNSDGQLGRGNPPGNSATPGQVSGLSNITAIAAGGNHSMALASDGSVWMWGENGAGQLGSGVPPNGQPTPTKIPTLTGVTAIATGPRHSLAVDGNGVVWAWGSNNDGEIGNAFIAGDVVTPTPVAGLISKATEVAAGTYDSYALLSDGSVWAWGKEKDGELGTACTTEICVMPKPVQVSGVTATHIAANDISAYAVATDGTVMSWGGPQVGSLGRDCSNCATPGSVPGLHDVVQIAAGGNHAVAVTKQGVVWAWGDNADEEVEGALKADHANAPVQVQGLPASAPVASLGAGHGFCTVVVTV